MKKASSSVLIDERMDVRLSGIFSLITLLISVISRADSSGVFEVKMMRFENPSGLKGSGKCCDGIFCTGICDNKFLFCLDMESNTGYTTCNYGSFQSEKFPDSESNVFGSNIQGVQNPIRIHVSGTVRKVALKVNVIDVDSTSDDDWLDTLNGDLTFSQFGSSYQVAWKSAQLDGIRSVNPTKLFVQYKAYCAEGFYGPSCTVYCTPQNNPVTGHYTCVLGTGAKRCLPGWIGPETSCLTPADPCVNTPCQNGGQCTGGNGVYTCTCTPPYTGPNCETNVCVPDPCTNGGTCTWSSPSYKCLCPVGYTGQHCETDVCSSNPCRHGSTCMRGGSSYVCLCADGYTGKDCEDEIDNCSENPCENGANCTSAPTTYMCSCAVAFSGQNCGEKIDYCKSTPCLHGATCTSGTSTFLCLCPVGLTGVQCESRGGNSVTATCLDGLCMSTTGAVSLQLETKRNNTGMYAGGGVSAVVVVVVVVIVVVIMKRKKRRINRCSSTNLDMESENRTTENVYSDINKNTLYSGINELNMTQSLPSTNQIGSFNASSELASRELPLPGEPQNINPDANAGKQEHDPTYLTATKVNSPYMLPVSSSNLIGQQANTTVTEENPYVLPDGKTEITTQLSRVTMAEDNLYVVPRNMPSAN